MSLSFDLAGRYVTIGVDHAGTIVGCGTDRTDGLALHMDTRVFGIPLWCLKDKLASGRPASVNGDEGFVVRNYKAYYDVAGKCGIVAKIILDKVT